MYLSSQPGRLLLISRERENELSDLAKVIFETQPMQLNENMELYYTRH